MSLLTSYTAATDANFIKKIHVALIDGALAIIAANTNPARVEFAKKILRDTPFWAQHFAFAAASDDATTNASTDAQIRARLAAVFPTFVNGA